jgi:hypothetical protein
MKHIKLFENFQDRVIELTMNDVRGIKHNLGFDDEDPDSFIFNYDLEEEDILRATPSGLYPPENWNGKEIQIYNLYGDNKGITKGNHWYGFAIAIDGKIEYLIGLDGPEECYFNTKKGIIIADGQEERVKILLETGIIKTKEI